MVTKPPRAGSRAEAEMALLIRALQLPAVEREFKFHETRRWRFDFAWPANKVAVEVDGVLWGSAVGRHQRKEGFENDCEKLNAAVLAGWRVFRFTPTQIKAGIPIAILDEVFRK